jgi:hypothetical protein
VNRYLCVLVLLSGLFACSKSGGLVEEKTTESNAYREYIIPKGQHYATGNNFRVLDKRSLHFKVRFDSSCIYTVAHAANASDINKLYGFNDCGSNHQENSARFGWVWNGRAIDLYAYCYNEGQRSSKLLASVSIEQEVELSLVAEPGKYIFTIGSKNEIMKRTCSSDQDQSYQLFPYFGGDEVAPHDVRIFIRDL